MSPRTNLRSAIALLVVGLLVVLVVALCSSSSSASSSRMRRFAPAFEHATENASETLAAARYLASNRTRRDRASRPRSHRGTRRGPDPYAGWQSWCESPTPVPCHGDEDCRELPSVAGRSQQCVRPWWATKGRSKERVCASPWPGRREQAWRRARIEEIAREICSKGSGACDPSDLAAFLTLVATRESSLRPWKAHRLNGDVRANRSAWAKQADRYDGSTHYDDRERWQGYGLFGQNSPLFVHHWDPAAPPEVLCREVEAVATYLTKARIALRKQADLGVPTTWASVHAALAMGEVRPKEASLDRFRKQARQQRSSLNVDARISERSLGRGLGRDVLARRLAAEILRGRLDVVTGRDPAEFVALSEHRIGVR
jgi:hypothetical protein